MTPRIAANVALCLLPALGLVGQNVPTGFEVDQLVVGGGLQRASDLTFLPDGRVLVTDSPGSLFMFVESLGASLTLVGTVPDVELMIERGLLSIAADPSFSTNGYIYVLYSSTQDDFLHVDRFTCVGDTANGTSSNLSFSPASRRVVLSTLPDAWVPHNGGSLRFGPDGMLYVSIGDDLEPCLAQDPTSQVGCLLRLNVTTLGPGPSTSTPNFSSLDPGDNPLSGGAGFERLVLAHGLRNPFRMEIDPVTGNLYIGDVGAGAREEVSEFVYQPGNLTLSNFGWPWREGDTAGPACAGSPPANLVEPIASFDHGQVTVMIGGPLYRNLGGNRDFGPVYESSYFLANFSGGLGHIRRLVSSGGTWVNAPAVPGQPSPEVWGDGFSNVVSLRQGPDGALWFLRLGYPAELGRIRPIPTSSVEAVSGNDQIGPSAEPLPSPLVVLLRDAQGLPVAGGQVDFVASSGATLSTTNPVVANANGFAQTIVTAPATGGAFTVSASTPGGTSPAVFHLFSRHLDAMLSGFALTLNIENSTRALNPQVPYIVLLSFPGSPSLPTIVGSLCIDPSYPLAIVIEDGTGVFGNVSFSGAGGIGSPGLTRSYAVPPGLFTGLPMRFQAIGFDALTGWFRTNCETYQF